MRKKPSIIKHIATLALLTMIRGLCALPRPIGLKVGKWIGLATFWGSKRRRQICETNLKLAFPDLGRSASARLCKKVFIENGRGLIETGWSWWSKPERFWRDMKVHGIEHLREATQNPNGVLLIGGHYSALDLGGLLFANISERFAATYRPHNSELVETQILKGRQRFMDLIDRNDIRSLFKALDNGQTVWFAPDQDLGRARSIFVDFFGVPAATNAGLQKLAKRGATPLVIGFHRNALGQYVIRFLPWEGDPSTQSPEEFAKTMNFLLEKMIRQEPAQYMWMHRRYKTRPEGEENIYSRVIR